VSRLTVVVLPGGHRRTSKPGWPRGPPPVGASRRDLSAGYARRRPRRSLRDRGSIPLTSTAGGPNVPYSNLTPTRVQRLLAASRFRQGVHSIELGSLQGGKPIRHTMSPVSTCDELAHQGGPDGSGAVLREVAVRRVDPFEPQAAVTTTNPTRTATFRFKTLRPAPREDAPS
jgi:hypothetical protein